MLDSKIIGSKIAEARKKANLSQAQLAQFLFISPQAVGKWERGESSPDIITFNRLAEILNVDLNYFSESFPVELKDTPDNIRKRAAKEDSNPSYSQERQLPINLTAVDLKDSDFIGATIHEGRFKASPLNGADFTNTNLIRSLFDVSDASNAKFDGANLTDCTFSITNLTNATFGKSILVRTTFDKSTMVGTQFTDVKLEDVKLVMTDLRKTIFENCIFNGVDFRYSDLRGMNFKGHTLIGVKFDKSALSNVSFSGATLKNVSFRLPFSVTNKSYRDFKTVSFEGAIMDKVTYATLKGLRIVDLSHVTLI